MSTLLVPSGVAVGRLKVNLSISHPFDSDLRIKLVSPGGRTVVLAEAVGTWGDDFSGATFADGAPTSIVSAQPPFAGSYRPVERLAVLNGSSRAGTWKLRVSDLRTRYSGQIDSWRLELADCAGTRQRTRAGAPTPPPLPQGVPTGQEPTEGTLVTVTTNSDASNGDVSSVQTLQSNPGLDGISLREATQATNNDPGTYTVRFDPSLAGATISLATTPLPVLRGGRLFIDGDIDGDGRPDVTLVDASSQQGGVGWGLNIASSDNRLHALALRGFTQGVLFTAMKTDQWGGPLLQDGIFAHNVVSGLVLRDVAAPISVQPTFGHEACEQNPCHTASRWLDTRIVGSSIDSNRNGAIWIGWASDDRDTMRRATVAGNEMHIGSKSVGTGIGEGAGIYVTVGTSGSSDNLISDALVAYNAIEIADGKAVQVLAGQQGRSGNVVEDVRIIANRVRFPHPRPATEAVSIFVSDDCWPPGHSDCRNAVRRIEVVGNVLKGAYVGVRVAEPCCNTTSSTVTHVRIASNVIKGVIAAPTEFEVPWGIAIGGQPHTVSDVSVDSNTIVQTTLTKKNYPAFLTAGGIALIGGLGKARTSVALVSVTNNSVTTKLIGILLLGGGPSGERSGQDNAIGDRVSRVEVRGNVVTRAPALAKHWYSKIKGISLIGGLGGGARPNRMWRTTGNRVKCVTVKGNIVAGKRNKFAVLSNLGAGASKNVARLGGC